MKRKTKFKRAAGSLRRRVKPLGWVGQLIERAQTEMWKCSGRLSFEAKTPGQKRLQKKHGTPREFAGVCIHALGDISIDECHKAIREYQREWEAA